MLLNGRLAEAERIGPRPLPASLSLLIHGLGVLYIVFSGPFEMPKTKTAFQLAIEGHEQKLVWYHFKEKLPAVKPTRAQKDDRPLRAERLMANQSIVSSPKNAPKAPQMIWQPAPEIKTDIKFDSANLVAVSMPKVDPPKQFVPPTQKPRLYTPQPDTSAAPPELQAAADNKPIKLANAPAMPRAVRDFQPPAPTAKAAVHQVTEVAPPEMQAGAAKQIDVARAGELSKVDRPYREFQPPPSSPKPGLSAVRYEDPVPVTAAAPTAGAGVAITGLGVETQLEKVYRPFVPPAAGGRGSGARGGKPGVSVPVLPAAPAIEASGDAPGDLNVAVVGLNPGNRVPNLPAISRPADFSAGPKLNPNGGSGDGSGSASVSVPDLTIRNGGKIDSRAGIMAKNTPPRVGLPTQTDALREAAKYITVDNIGHPSATRVSNGPDSRFDGRTVYMMAIQMPNITSYVGSWLMWYSERSARPVSTAVITPPSANRKVDPKYLRVAIDERIQGTVRLAAIIRSDGTVGSVELLKGIDDRLDQTAEAALAKWQFTPAMRDGNPIDVDIVVEIPFRLAPQTADK